MGKFICLDFTYPVFVNIDLVTHMKVCKKNGGSWVLKISFTNEDWENIYFETEEEARDTLGKIAKLLRACEG